MNEQSIPSIFGEIQQYKMSGSKLIFLARNLSYITKWLELSRQRHKCFSHNRLRKENYIFLSFEMT